MQTSCLLSEETLTYADVMCRWSHIASDGWLLEPETTLSRDSRQRFLAHAKIRDCFLLVRDEARLGIVFQTSADGTLL